MISLQLWPETFLILRRTERDMFKNVQYLHANYPSFLSDFNMNFVERFSKNNLLNIKWVFWFSLIFFSETFFNLRRNERDNIEKVCWFSSKVPFMFVRFEWNLNSLERFSKNAQVQNFMKITDTLHVDKYTFLII